MSRTLLATLVLSATLLLPCTVSADTSPEAVEHLVRLERILVERGTSAALHAWEELPQNVRTSPWGITARAAIDAAAGRWTESMRGADQARADHEDIGLAWTLACRARVALGRTREAHRVCEEAIARDGDRPDPWRSACAAQMAEHAWSVAWPLCASGADRFPDDGGLLWRAGYAALALGRYGDAEARCRRAATTQERSSGLFCLGFTRLRQERPTEALAICEQGGSEALPLLCQGEALTALDRPEEGRQRCRAALQSAPEEALVHLCLARAERALGQAPEAISSLENALRIQPTLREATQLLADTYLDAGRPDEAISTARSLVETSPSSRNWARLARVQMEAGRLPDSLESWQQALRLEPNHPEYLFHLGEAHRRQDNFPEALSWMIRAAEASPNDPRFLLEAHRIAQAAGQAQETLALLAASAQRHPDQVALQQAHCREALRAREAMAARASCTRLVALRPEYPEPHGLLAAVHLHLEDHAQAVLSAERAIALGASDAFTLLTLGNALVQLRRNAEAIAPLERATSVSPQSAQAWYMLGVARHNLQEPEPARQAFCRAAEVAENARYRAACESGRP